MARQETSKKAFDIQGDKPYHECARAALPLLVRQATARSQITYGSLAKELGMPNPRNLSYPLGSIGDSLIQLDEEWKQPIPIPQIQTIVVRKDKKLPGPGISEFLSSFAELTSEQQQELVKGKQREVYAYRRWGDVLRALGLEPVASNAESLVEAARVFIGGGESEDHRRLKEYVRAHPKIIGFQHTCEARVERSLPSGDALDVSLESQQYWTAVEVKSAKSREGDLVRGLFQCVKYKAVMEAVLAAEGKRNDKDVDAILAVEGKLPSDLLPIAHSLGVQFVEVTRKGSSYQRIL